MHNLQDRCGIVFLKASLVIGLAAISQRMIHIYKDIAIERPFRINQRDLAGEVFRNFSAGVLFVGEFLQGDAVRLVISRRAHR